MDTLERLDSLPFVKSFTARPFNHRVVVFRWDSLNELERYLPGVPEPEDSCWARVIDYRTTEGYQLLLVSFREERVSINTLCHESVHIKNFILTSVGQRPDPYNDEFEAYLTGWICDEVFSLWGELHDNR